MYNGNLVISPSYQALSIFSDEQTSGKTKNVKKSEQQKKNVHSSGGLNEMGVEVGIPVGGAGLILLCYVIGFVIRKKRS